MSLLKELGFAYASDVFRGAGFRHPETGDACIFIHVSDAGVVEANRITPEFRDERTHLAHTQFSDWSAFSFPTLGYRELHDFGVLAYGVKLNSTRRGLHPRDVRWTLHDVCYETAAYSEENNYNRMLGSNNVIAKCVFNPTFTRFSEGLPALLAGDLPFFAMSAEFAVAPHADIEGAEILYRRRRVGTISPTGTVALNVRNEHITSLWNQEIKNG